MKVKQSAGDFIVSEILEFPKDPGGRFHIHKLKKSKLSTHEAIDRICRVTGLGRGAIAFAGLKDRQGRTEQWISIEGKRVTIDEADLKVFCVGRSARKIDSTMSKGNRFKVVVRDLKERELVSFDRNLAVVQKFGLPNYFDDQRFRCLEQGQGFILLDLLRGRTDVALRRLLASKTPAGKRETGDAKLRRLLDRFWGQWEDCGRIARGPMYQKVFRHLQKFPEDYEGALAEVPVRTKTIHLFAFQSFLWNRMVGKGLMEMLGRRGVSLASVAGPLFCWGGMEAERFEELRGLELPLIDGGTRVREPVFQKALTELLAEKKLSLGDLDALRLPGFCLKEEMRRLVLKPEDLEVGPVEKDDRNREAKKRTISFRLPRGAYATLVVKRLFAKDAGGRPPWGRRRRRR
ncbi:MAG TPA: tRNA pseudouridine(13) synthase TruD [Planctomycetes bacterium]|nr:tRNA pseudouridine(13) synthase TruD [Planctomycetota bacterium]